MFRQKNNLQPNTLLPYAFVLPAFLIHCLVVTLPALSIFVMAFFEWNGLGGATFIGFGNFVKMFTDDPVLKVALINNLKWLAIFITIPIILAFFISIFVSRLKRFQMTLRTIYFLPYVISAAVAGKIWASYYNPYYGLSVIFDKIGLDKLADVLWLSNPKIALYSVAFVDNWHWWGFVMVLILGALQQIDKSLYEAAEIDGANRFQQMRFVTIPGIKETLAFILIMTVMFSFLTFDYVYVMTNGGPSNTTEILATWIYKNAFIRYNAGYANALCVVQSAICLVFYFIQRYLRNKGGLQK